MCASFCKIEALYFLLRPGRGVVYCDQPVGLCVCLSVCLRAYVRNRWTDPHKNFSLILCGRGPVFFRRRSATLLCTSGSMDDVTFGHNGRDAERWTTAINDVAIPRRSLMSMNACFNLGWMLSAEIEADIHIFPYPLFEGAAKQISSKWEVGTGG